MPCNDGEQWRPVVFCLGLLGVIALAGIIAWLSHSNFLLRRVPRVQAIKAIVARLSLIPKLKVGILTPTQACPPYSHVVLHHSSHHTPLV